MMTYPNNLDVQRGACGLLWELTKTIDGNNKVSENAEKLQTCVTPILAAIIMARNIIEGNKEAMKNDAKELLFLACSVLYNLIHKIKIDAYADSLRTALVYALDIFLRHKFDKLSDLELKKKIEYLKKYKLIQSVLLFQKSLIAKSLITDSKQQVGDSSPECTTSAVRERDGGINNEEDADDGSPAVTGYQQVGYIDYDVHIKYVGGITVEPIAVAVEQILNMLESYSSPLVFIPNEKDVLYISISKFKMKNSSEKDKNIKYFIDKLIKKLEEFQRQHLSETRLAYIPKGPSKARAWQEAEINRINRINRIKQKKNKSHSVVASLQSTMNSTRDGDVEAMI